MRIFSFLAAGIMLHLQLATSQELSDIPVCAQQCIVTAITDTSCTVTDAHCICAKDSFTSQVAGCIPSACSASDQSATLTFVQKYCAKVGVTVTLPSSSGSASASGSASSSTASTGGSGLSSSGSASASATSSGSAASGSSSGSSGSASAAVSPATSSAAAAAPGRVLGQEWAGLVGVLGLGVAAVL
ncbi:hypothetical protein ABEF95_010692 [Exophiala dermatitidis]